MGKLRKNEGFTLVEIMIVVSIIGSLAAIAAPNLLRNRLTANEATAKTTLKTMGTAAEAYAANFGKYPTSINNLTTSNPPYLNKDYTASPTNGYNYTCNWAATRYSCSARPTSIDISGSKQYSITQGMALTESIARDAILNITAIALVDEEPVAACTKNCDSGTTGGTFGNNTSNSTSLLMN